MNSPAELQLARAMEDMEAGGIPGLMNNLAIHFQSPSLMPIEELIEAFERVKSKSEQLAKDWHSGVIDSKQYFSAIEELGREYTKATAKYYKEQRGDT